MGSEVCLDIAGSVRFIDQFASLAAGGEVYEDIPASLHPSHSPIASNGVVPMSVGVDVVASQIVPEHAASGQLCVIEEPVLPLWSLVHSISGEVELTG